MRLFRISDRFKRFEVHQLEGGLFEFIEDSVPQKF